MPRSLDPSHRTVLESLALLERANQCLQDTRDYVWEILDEIGSELTLVHPEFAFRPTKGTLESWFQTEIFKRRPQSVSLEITIGIQEIDPSQILSKGSRAYLHCAKRSGAEASGHAAFLQQLRKFAPPPGFVLNAGNYVFTQRLVPLRIDGFLDRANLKSHLTAPLQVLADWAVTNQRNSP